MNDVDKRLGAPNYVIPLVRASLRVVLFGVCATRGIYTVRGPCTEMLLSRDPSNFPELTTSDHEIDYFQCASSRVVIIIYMCVRPRLVGDVNDQDFFFSYICYTLYTLQQYTYRVYI